ncbi:MAG TPA: L,D-transpeptidase [Acidimicrobiales bacterium]|nr:L,D-transpeptidase [Acidimicrobiales bacterium]
MVHGRCKVRGIAILATAAVVFGLGGCGGATTRASHNHGLKLPFGTPSTVAETSDPLQAPPGSVLVATATVPSLPIYGTPRALGSSQALANPNPLGAPLTLLVKAVQGGWLQVYLPERPNEMTGWVTRSNVSLATDDEHIVVSLSSRQVTLYRAGAQVFHASVAVGAPDAPTPTGHFFVTEVLQLTDPGDAYGPYALGLSGFSNTYFSFDGGPGQIAIHGTNQPWVIGGYASHGCVRLTNPEITALATQVPAGTPVDVVA